MKILFKIDRVFIFLELLSRCINVSNVQKKIRLRRISFPGKIAYGNKKNAKVPYGKSFGKSPPTPGGVLWVKLNKHDIHVIFPPRDLCFTFLHSRKPYGPTVTTFPLAPPRRRVGPSLAGSSAAPGPAHQCLFLWFSRKQKMSLKSLKKNT